MLSVSRRERACRERFLKFLFSHNSTEMNWNSMLCLVQKIIVSKRYLKLIVLFG
jgi:hypothetical protein